MLSTLQIKLLQRPPEKSISEEKPNSLMNATNTDEDKFLNIPMFVSV